MEQISRLIITADFAATINELAAACATPQTAAAQATDTPRTAAQTAAPQATTAPQTAAPQTAAHTAHADTQTPGCLLCIYPPLHEQPRAATVADIAAIERAAALAHERSRLFVLAFCELSAVVQNRLLKLLEEPPAGVKFALLSASKSTILPTVRSRLPLQFAARKESAKPLAIDIRALSETDIAAYSPAAPLGEFITALLLACREQKIRLDASALELFGASYRLAAAAHPSAALIASALLLAARRCAKER